MPKVILSVDDSRSIRQMVSFTLTQAGYQVLEAVDGKDALTKLAGNQLPIACNVVQPPQFAPYLMSVFGFQ